MLILLRECTIPSIPVQTVQEMIFLGPPTTAILVDRLGLDDLREAVRPSRITHKNAAVFARIRRRKRTATHGARRNAVVVGERALEKLSRR